MPDGIALFEAYVADVRAGLLASGTPAEELEVVLDAITDGFYERVGSETPPVDDVRRALAEMPDAASYGAAPSPPSPPPETRSTLGLASLGVLVGGLGLALASGDPDTGGAWMLVTLVVAPVLGILARDRYGRATVATAGALALLLAAIVWFEGV
jgi:hypothetical protein